MKVFYAATILILCLSGCASRDKPARDSDLAGNIGEAAGSTVSQTGEGFADAALSPLEDLNLKRREIPPLLAAMASPYHVPADLTCEELDRMIAELEGVLGPDWDAPKPDERLKTEVLGDEAAQAALGAVESGVTGWIPFRGLIRKATGAESHEKKYNRAYKIGAQRRTYLKGYGLAKGCPAPAKPDFLTLHLGEVEQIIYKEDTPAEAAPVALPPG
ncbi:MAG: hypothetical protein C0421_12750 [Hyphomonas sp.]|jgi:hypothetical protein|uniref:hypothetical protein n=1 Tax=Hyphomonas sp. TaxID=87 RepID=UPI000AF4B209|nr:hypothetical protein [Hyphomonas sp.]MBA4339702.1 hypothetical protein [Hyphomonas sp.]